jgi:hypothetical protein
MKWSAASSRPSSGPVIPQLLVVRFSRLRVGSLSMRVVSLRAVSILRVVSMCAGSLVMVLFVHVGSILIVGLAMAIGIGMGLATTKDAVLLSVRCSEQLNACFIAGNRCRALGFAGTKICAELDLREVAELDDGVVSKSSA